MIRWSIALLLVAGCVSTDDGFDGEPVGGKQDGASDSAAWHLGPGIPEPIANNAVAARMGEGGCEILTALGIDVSLQGSGAHSRAYLFRQSDGVWQRLADVPGPGRLAASAVAIGGSFYVLGGYSVGPGGSETSHAEVLRWEDVDQRWEPVAPLPVPIDDAVAVAWRDRWIVVVSGWSNTHNVDAVQIFDTNAGTWLAGTPFPGTPAFGHAGAISGDDLVVVDGASSSFGFPIVNQTWLGRLNPGQPSAIEWIDLGGHPGPARYRAAGGTAPDGSLWFHGGTGDPYNFDGLSYGAGTPSPPLATTLVYDPATGEFRALGLPKPTPTMDHRSLVECDGLTSVGGMAEGPVVTSDVWTLRP